MGIWDDITGTTAKRNAAKGLESYNNQQAGIYADQTRQQFGDLAARYEALQGTAPMDAANGARAFLDPSIAYQQQQATKSVLGAFGSRGLNGGSAIKALSDRQQGIASQGFQQAMENYMRQSQANNALAMQGNQQNFNNNFQTASMVNQADATKFNAAAQGRANVASVQAPSAWDAFTTLGGMGAQLGAAYLGRPA